MEAAPEQARRAPEAALGLTGRLGAAAASGAMAAAVLARFGFDPRGVIEAAFVAVLPPLAAIDIERRILPNRIVIPALAAVLVAQLAFFSSRAPEWLAAAAGAAVFLMLPLVVYRGGVGMGDVKLAGLLGAALGRDVVTAMLVASFAMFPLALVLVARGGREAKKTGIPFGPFLALGGVAAALIGSHL